MSNPEPSPVPPAANAAVGLIGPARARADLARAFGTCGTTVLEFDLGRAETSSVGADAGSASSVTSVQRPRLAEPDALVVCVPVARSPAGGADTGMLAATGRVVAGHLRDGQLVVLTGPVPPGTTRDVLLPALAATGRVAGRDFPLAYSSVPLDGDRGRVVGGFDEASGRAAVALFARAGLPAIPASSLEAAEVTGAVAPVAAGVRSALAHELRVACARLGVDVWEVLAASGVSALVPTLGNCPPELPLLVWGARRQGASVRLLELARETHAAVPGHVVSKVADALNDAGKPVRGSAVAILGVADQKDAGDPRESPSFELMDHLLKKGARVSYNDPHIPSLLRTRHRPRLEPMTSQPLTPEYLAEQDCVLIATDHTVYNYHFIVQNSRLVIDTRNATEAVTEGRGKIVRV